MTWELAARIVLLLALPLILPPVGRSIGARLGVEPNAAELASSALFLAMVWVSVLWRELPRRGWSFLYKWLMASVLIGWLGAIIWYAGQINHDQWIIFKGSLCVLLTIGIVLGFGWVACNDPEGRTLFWRVVFGPRRGPKLKNNVDGDGFGLD
jgi:hypothetical protein